MGHIGQFGNQLFQIAAVTGMARKSGHECLFPHWHCYISGTDYNKYFVRNPPQGNVFNHEWISVRERKFSYNEFHFHADRDYDLWGYFQTEKYFKHCEQEIRELFELKPEYEAYIDDKYDFRDTCSLHIRRGDYLKDPDIFPIMNLSYYKYALNLLYGDRVNDMRLFVFSNDTPWCRAHIKHPQITFVENEKNIIDMFIMSKCQDNIIANSSFSWWGAWLNKNPRKRVVAPQTWLHANTNFDCSQVVCEEWMSLRIPIEL